MSLAVPLRLTALFRMTPPGWSAPEPRRIRRQRIDPCAMTDYLRRDVGLESLPCPPTRDLARLQ